MVYRLTGGNVLCMHVRVPIEIVAPGTARGKSVYTGLIKEKRA